MTPIRTPLFAPVKVYDLLTFKEFAYLSCHPMFVNLGQFYTFNALLPAKLFKISSMTRLNASNVESLPTNHLPHHPLLHRHTTSRKKTDITCDATSPGPHQGRVSALLSNQSGAKSATTEIIDISDDESCGALALEAMFWTKSVRSPTIILLDDRNTTIVEILGVFNDGDEPAGSVCPEISRFLS
ncbi:hypothetical protein IW261DRAFT_1425987 [Armillaria novae-zelandiae]|uniref:Uncharacterized protein n=1 Tax=Armillaria novae-zelandiae TaxID=153914 RepID=A0AA39NNW2_9AGAR|nr:hypothetical protein IW261DRAFT_1425987 [Armillaria novae-zelandiae]